LTVNISGKIGTAIKDVSSWELVYWDIPNDGGDPQAIWADERGPRGSDNNIRRLVAISERKFRSRHNMSRFLARYYGKTGKEPDSGSEHDRKFATQIMRSMVQIGSIYEVCIGLLDTELNRAEFTNGTAGLTALLNKSMDRGILNGLKLPPTTTFGDFFMHALVNGRGVPADEAFVTIGVEHAISYLDRVKDIATDYERNHLIGRALGDAPENGEGSDSVPVLLACL
jgi:hypothetical protein